MKTQYIIFSRVASVSERFERIYVGGTGDKAKFEEKSTGWFVFLEGSHEGLYIDVVKPDLDKGDFVQLTLEKIGHAHP